MGELASYSLSDFILFSGSAYYRLFELYNRDVWPLHLLALLFAALVLYKLVKAPVWGGRVTGALLAICWTWVAFAFLYQRFYPLHVVANWYALGFVVQALLLAWYGILRNSFGQISHVPLKFAFGWMLLLSGLVAYPFLAILSGRHWLQFEMFGLAPDPTALATIGLMLIYRTPAGLLFIPVAWLVVSYTTQVVM